MAKILILGGYGFTGRSIARHLVEESGAELVVAGRHLDQAEALASELNGVSGSNRVCGLQVDAADSAGLRRSLEGVDLLVVAAPATRHAETVIRAALEVGVDYLDVQLGARKLALLQSLTAQIQESGRCFVTEAGFHPGLPSALVRLAAASMDRIEAVTVACYLNVGPALPYTGGFDELIEIFTDYQGQVFRNGQWTRPGLAGASVCRVDFGGKIGVRKCYSLFMEELRALPEIFPDLANAGFYMAETNWITDRVITPLVLLGLKVAPRRGIRSLGKLMWWSMHTFARPPFEVVLKVEAIGRRSGKPVRVEAAVSHPDGYELTAIPVVAALLQYLDGSARRPGLWMMGQWVDPARLFADMSRIGIRVSQK